jgi:hypothetical protein
MTAPSPNVAGRLRFVVVACPSIPIAETHRMSVTEARTEVQAEGFLFDRVIPGLPRQHIIVFRKPASSIR